MKFLLVNSMYGGNMNLSDVKLKNYGLSFYFLVTSILCSLGATVLQFFCFNKKETAIAVPYLQLMNRANTESQQQLMA